MKTTKEERRKLLREIPVIETLDTVALWNLVLWEIFKPYKADTFYARLKDGMHARASYNYALNTKRKK